MNFLDTLNLNPKGFVTVVQTDVKTGKAAIVLQENNLVVSNFRSVLRDALFGDSNKLPTTIKLGDLNMVLTGNLVSVTPPAMGDLALVHEVYSAAVTSKTKVTVTDRPGIEFILDISESQVNGSGNQIISEMGLFTSSGDLIARKTFPALIKNSSVILSFRWKILF